MHLNEWLRKYLLFKSKTVEHSNVRSFNSTENAIVMQYLHLIFAQFPDSTTIPLRNQCVCFLFGLKVAAIAQV